MSSWAPIEFLATLFLLGLYFIDVFVKREMFP